MLNKQNLNDSFKLQIQTLLLTINVLLPINDFFKINNDIKLKYKKKLKLLFWF